MLELSAEDWVTTDTARVTAVVDAAVGANQAFSRADMTKAIDRLAPNTDWRVTEIDRTQDPTGLERWRAVFEARLPENKLGGLAEAATAASRPGLQLRIAGVDFTPTLAEVETARARLRAEIYRRAGAEIDALKAAFPRRSFRIGRIDFIEGGPRLAAPTLARARAEPTTMTAAAAPEPSTPLNVAEKLRLDARVVLSALPTE